MQSEVILLSNVKQDNIANLVQKEFEMFGITGIKGKRIDADRAAIHKNVAEALADYNVIVVIGGMGEAEENMTVSAVAAAIGFNTVQKEGELFPEGAEIFKNRDGKPSGCAISQGNQCIIMLPGESDTLQFMLCYRTSKYLADFIGGAYSIKTLRAAGINKAAAEEAVSLAETAQTAVRVYEDKGEIAVQVYATGADRKEAAGKVNGAIKSLAERFGSAAYAVDAENVGQAFGKELSKKDLKVAIAAEGITREEIARIAYTNEFVGNYLGTSQGVQKYNIPEKLLQRHGVNSTWTAAVLAGEVAKTYGSNIGIAITADPAKPGEGANIAVCMGDNLWTEHIVGENYDALIAAAGARAIHIARSVVFAYPKLYDNAASLMGAVSGKSKFKTAKSEAGERKWYARFVPMKGDSKTDLIRKIIFIVSVLVFIGSMAYLSTKVFDGTNQDTLANQVITDTNIENFTEEEKEAASTWAQENNYNEWLYKLFQQNNDLIGYIKIDDTNVDFPVVQTVKANDAGDTGQYYLRKDFNGNKSTYGTPFLDYRCQAKPSAQSTNLIIYGHNVYDDGRMFSDLIKYRRLKFYKSHPLIQFDTLYGDQDWLVVGVVLTNAYEKDGPVWNYNNFINGTTEQTEEFIKQIARRTMIVTGVDYNVNDKYLTLSTCSYDFKDARVVIIARAVREGEDITTLDTEKAYYNSNPVMPDKWYQAISEAQKSESDASFGDAEEIENVSPVISIELAQIPAKLEYKVGEELITSGIRLNVYREDGSMEQIKEGFTVEPASGKFTQAGEFPINVIYGEFSIAFYVKVTEGESTSTSTSSEVEVPVNSVEIFKKPNKLTYKIGETLDTTGLVVRLVKTDGSVEDIQDITPENEKLKFTPALNKAFDKAGKQTIKVTCGEYSATFEVTVNDPTAVKAIEIAAKPNKLVYKVGEKLDTAGLTLKVTKMDESTENVTSGFTVTPEKFNEAGEITVTVTYKEFTATFKVKVEAESSSSESSTSSSSESSESTSSESVPSTPSQSVPETSASSTPDLSVESSSEVNNVGGSYVSGASRYYADSLYDTVRINGTTMSVFDAVCQIVAYEAGYGQPDEHVKAQAVASYTYVMHHGGNVSAGVKTKVTQQIKDCVAEVIGYAVLDDRSNKFILATYFSESCGETANAEWVWGYPNRNLISVSSPVDGKQSKTYTISSSDFASKVSSKAGITLSGDPSSWISIESYWGDTDFVNKVNLGGKSYSARKLRESVLGNSKLRSTAFDVRYNSANDSFVFTMRGYGHGVGMSAVGSIAYAKMGYSWDEILLKYYSNCYIGMKY